MKDRGKGAFCSMKTLLTKALQQDERNTKEREREKRGVIRGTTERRRQEQRKHRKGDRVKGDDADDTDATERQTD